ncbi:MAG: helix-turn-helix domain-containing protein [Lachnospiraceae bacterium]
MKFSELLNHYMNILHLTNKELSDLSGISPSVISRYRNGEREPQADSDIVDALTGALALVASERDQTDMSKDTILASFQDALLAKSRDYDRFLHNFNVLYDELGLNMKNISAFTNFDTSFLYRIKSGERKTSDLSNFCKKISEYLVSSYSSPKNKEKVARLLGSSTDQLAEKSEYYTAVYEWLLADGSLNDNSYPKQKKPSADISKFLTRMDEFDLEDYIKVIHFDEIKVPTMPFHLPANKIYYGISRMREGELDFFKTTVTSKTTAPIFMHSDMPLLDMAEDMDFNKKWMFAIACSIKKGLHLNIIHHLDRPFEELLLGLEAWIPIYMTGQVSPYYIPDSATPVFHHLNYVSGVAALCGESIEGSPLDGRYILTNNKEEVAYFQKKAAHVLSHAKPLMEIYDSTGADDYHAFLLQDAGTVGERKNILSSLPLYTLSEELLEKILASNQVEASTAQMIRDYRKSEIERMKQKLNNGTVADEIAISPRDTYEKHPMHLSISGCFQETPIFYSYEEMLAHLQETRQYAKTHENYILNINEISAFRNIQIEIVKNQYVIVSKIKSPSIHFVIRHPQMVQALQNFTVPVVENPF